MAIESTPAGTAGTQGIGAHHGTRTGRGKSAEGPAGGFSALLNGLDLQAETPPVATDEVRKPAQPADDSASRATPGAPEAVAQPQSPMPQATTPPQAEPTDSATAEETQPRIARHARAERTPPATRPAPSMAEPQAAQDAQAAQGTTEEADPASETIAELVARLRPAGTAQEGIPTEDRPAKPHRATIDLAAGAAADRAQRAVQAALARAMGSDPARSAVLAQVHQAASATGDVRDARRAAGTGGADNSLSALTQVLASLESSGFAIADKGQESSAGNGNAPGTGTPAALLAAEAAAPRATQLPGEPGFAAVAAGQSMAPDELLASRVSVWVSQKAQSAELQLDGFGDQPVQVQIALQGNEAHVSFRSDLPQVRELLQGAAAELRQMLQGEGLQLAGLSVGGSGADGAAAGGREGARGQATPSREPAAEQSAAGQPAPQRPARPQGMLDLFA